MGSIVGIENIFGIPSTASNAAQSQQAALIAQYAAMQASVIPEASWQQWQNAYRPPARIYHPVDESRAAAERELDEAMTDPKYARPLEDSDAGV